VLLHNFKAANIKLKGQTFSFVNSAPKISFTLGFEKQNDFLFLPNSKQQFN
jgi:hypothetical protein